MDSLIQVLPVLLILVMAAYVSELAGALNVAVEGIMLLGSFLVALPISGTLGVVAGVVLSVLTGLTLGLFLGSLNSRFGANIFIAGLGMNLLVSNATGLLGLLIFRTKGVVLFDPAFTGIWTSGATITISLAVYLFIHVSYSWSLMGLRFRSLGNHGEMLHARGVNTHGYKVWALGVSGALAALAGALTSINLHAFVPGGTMGQGWVALVLVYVGARHPLGILLATMVYLVLQQGGTWLQRYLDNPALALGLPYLGLLVILVMVQGVSRKRFDL